MLYFCLIIAAHDKIEIQTPGYVFLTNTCQKGFEFAKDLTDLQGKSLFFCQMSTEIGIKGFPRLVAIFVIFIVKKKQKFIIKTLFVLSRAINKTLIVNREVKTPGSS